MPVGWKHIFWWIVWVTILHRNQAQVMQMLVMLVDGVGGKKCWFGVGMVGSIMQLLYAKTIHRNVGTKCSGSPSIRRFFSFFIGQ